MKDEEEEGEKEIKEEEEEREKEVKGEEEGEKEVKEEEEGVEEVKEEVGVILPGHTTHVSDNNFGFILAGISFAML